MNLNQNHFPFMSCKISRLGTTHCPLSNKTYKSYKSYSAFTLIEVMLAVSITGLVALGIFRFVQANLMAVGVSIEQSARDVSMRALMKILQDQLNALPVMESGALLGEAHLFNKLPSDEMQWICSAGPGLFTIQARGDYKVTLRLKPTPTSGVFDLGIRRMIADATNKDENWWPLMREMKALEIRYFDPRINAWLEKWTDLSTRPTLVRLRLWRVNDDSPYEQVLSLPLTTRRSGP